MRSRLILRLAFYVVVPFAIALLVYKYINSNLLAPIDLHDKSQVLVDIEPASTFSAICRKLEKQGLVKHWRVLDIIGRLKGKSVQIKAGEYVFSRSMTPAAIFQHLSSGLDYRRQLKIQAGMNIYSIASLVQTAGINQANNFLLTAVDTELLVRAGLQVKSFEGYLATGEYSFSKNTKLPAMLWELFEKADKAWTIQHQQQAQRLNLSRNEVLIIASLLQKEVFDPAQYRIFSGLIFNRLRSQRKLELESTLRYALRNYSGIISEAMKANRSPYNTFYFVGLPPTPICIPSEVAILSALNPETHNFQEFARSPTGQINFK